MALSRRQRLTGTRRFANVFATSRPIHGEGVSVRCTRRAPGQAAFTVIVPVAVSVSAVRRNRLRRRVSEQLRRLLDARTAVDGTDCVITVQRDMTAKEAETALVMLLKKSGILQG